MWNKIISKIKNSKLAYKLIVSIILIVVIPIVLMGLLNYKNVYDQIKAHNAQEARADMDMRKSQITEKIKAIENFTTNLGFSLYLSNFLAADYTVDDYNEYMTIRSYLLSMLGSNSKFINNISIYYVNDTIPEHWPNILSYFEARRRIQSKI